MAFIDDNDDPALWDLYEIPDSNPINLSLINKSDEDSMSKTLINPSIQFDSDEDSRIKSLVDTPALKWHQPLPKSAFNWSRGFTGGGGRLISAGGPGFMSRTPPEGYICRRCNVAGHFIQHCPTNGDPKYDIKKIKPPTGIPKSMLNVSNNNNNSDGGFYELPNGDVADLKPDEAAFEREIEGLPTKRGQIGKVPKELYCQLCKQIMNFAVLCSKCCFQSFCDECIRNFIISNRSCVCGVKDVLADDLLPNLTVRRTINRIMESNDGSVDNGGCSLQVTDMESNNRKGKFVVSPTQSGISAAKDVGVVVDEACEVIAVEKNAMCGDKEEVVVAEVMADNCGTKGVVQDSVGREGRNFPVAGEEYDRAKKKKRKIAKNMPLEASDMQWGVGQNLSAENYMMSMAFASYNNNNNPYWTQPGMGGFFGPYPGAFPYNGFGVGPWAMSNGGVLPQQDQFVGPPLMGRNRDGLEVGKPVSSTKYEPNRRESSKDQELDREKRNSSDDIFSRKSKNINVSSMSSYEHDHHRSRRPSPDQHGRSYKRPSRDRDEHYHYQGDRDEKRRGYDARENQHRSRHSCSVRTYH